jgi:hypothetical protein
MFREELWREGIGIAIIRRVKDCRFDLIFRVESQAKLGFSDLGLVL